MTRDAGDGALGLLLVDGDNVLHEVRGSRDAGGVAWLLPRLVAWRPTDLRIVVALDGHPPPGESRRPRVARGIEFAHSGSRSADDLIVEVLESMPFTERARAAVVTRDRDLQARARRSGGLVRSVEWLIGVLGASHPPPGDGQPGRIGQGRPPRGRHRPDAGEEATEERTWQPGRGATRKKGNPRRTAKRPRRR